MNKTRFFPLVFSFIGALVLALMITTTLYVGRIKQRHQVTTERLDAAHLRLDFRLHRFHKAVEMLQTLFEQPVSDASDVLSRGVKRLPLMQAADSLFAELKVLKVNEQSRWIARRLLQHVPSFLSTLLERFPDIDAIRFLSNHVMLTYPKGWQAHDGLSYKLLKRLLPLKEGWEVVAQHGNPSWSLNFLQPVTQNDLPLGLFLIKVPPAFLLQPFQTVHLPFGRFLLLDDKNQVLVRAKDNLHQEAQPLPLESVVSPIVVQELEKASYTGHRSVRFTTLSWLWSYRLPLTYGPWTVIWLMTPGDVLRAAWKEVFGYFFLILLVVLGLLALAVWSFYLHALWPLRAFLLDVKKISCSSNKKLLPLPPLWQQSRQLVQASFAAMRAKITQVQSEKVLTQKSLDKTARYARYLQTQWSISEGAVDREARRQACLEKLRTQLDTHTQTLHTQKIEPSTLICLYKTLEHLSPVQQNETCGKTEWSVLLTTWLPLLYQAHLRTPTHPLLYLRMTIPAEPLWTACPPWLCEALLFRLVPAVLQAVTSFPKDEAGETKAEERGISLVATVDACNIILTFEGEGLDILQVLFSEVSNDPQDLSVKAAANQRVLDAAEAIGGSLAIMSPRHLKVTLPKDLSGDNPQAS